MDHDPRKSLGMASSDATGPAPDPALRRCIHNQSLTGQYNTGNWLISAVSSWNQIKFDQYASAPAGGVRTVPEYWLENIQELRAATQGAGHTIDAIVGLYHHDTRWDKAEQMLNNNFTPRGLKSSFRANQQSFSAYTDLTWHVTSQLDFGAGLRFSHDAMKIKHNTQGILRSGNISANNLLGQVSAGYQLTPQNRIYARIAQGYRPAGYDIKPGNMEPYKAETSISYEIGNKYQNEIFHLQGDVFYTNTTNLINVKNTGPWMYSVTNLGNTRALGAELAGGYYFMPGWEIGANVGVVHAKFTDDLKNNTTYSGRRVPSVPDFTAAIYLNGSINTAVGTITTYIGVNAVGSYTFGDYDFKQSAYTTTNLRIGWQATDRINISAYVNNLFDKRYFIFADSRFADYGSDYGYANIGRKAGVDLKIDLF